ncbi:MAG: LysR family transcriptional regulator, partial [Pseudomonadota bacterium]
LFARDDVGLAVVPPIGVRDELAAGALHEAAPLKGITETFVAVTLQRRFPNPVLARLLA